VSKISGLEQSKVGPKGLNKCTQSREPRKFRKTYSKVNDTNKLAKSASPILGVLFHPLLSVEVVGLPETVADGPEVPVVFELLVADAVMVLNVVASGLFQLVTVQLAVTTPPSYKLQVKTAPLTGAARPPRVFVNGSVPFLGIVAASKN
jgi:hypothetical protein